MKRSLLLCLLMAGLGLSNAVLADANLARSKNCMACHAVGNKVLGPSFKDIAAKYKGQKGVEDKLAQKITKGGSGTWGAVPMPANTQVSDAEARQLVQWIMTLN